MLPSSTENKTGHALCKRASSPQVQHPPFAGEGEAHGLDLTTVDYSANEQLACKWINLVKRSQYDCPNQSSFLAGRSTCKAIFHCPFLFLEILLLPSWIGSSSPGQKPPPLTLFRENISKAPVDSFSFSLIVLYG